MSAGAGEASANANAVAGDGQRTERERHGDDRARRAQQTRHQPPAVQPITREDSEQKAAARERVEPCCRLRPLRRERFAREDLRRVSVNHESALSTVPTPYASAQMKSGGSRLIVKLVAKMTVAVTWAIITMVPIGGAMIPIRATGADTNGYRIAAARTNAHAIAPPRRKSRCPARENAKACGVSVRVVSIIVLVCPLCWLPRPLGCSGNPSVGHSGWSLARRSGTTLAAVRYAFWIATGNPAESARVAKQAALLTAMRLIEVRGCAQTPRKRSQRARPARASCRCAAAIRRLPSRRCEMMPEPAGLLPRAPPSRRRTPRAPADAGVAGHCIAAGDRRMPRVGVQ